MRALLGPGAFRLCGTALGLLCGLSASCAGPGAVSLRPSAAGPSLATPRAEGVPAELEPLCSALGRAVAAREDEHARVLLARLRARAPAGRAAELAEGYGRILAGRAELSALELTLALEPLPGAREGADDGAERARLVLVARQPGPGPLRLRLGPATLLSALELVDARGREAAWRESTSLDPLGDLLLAPDEPRVVPLAEVELGAPPEALAARSRFELVLRSGELERAGRSLPASDPRVAPLVALRAAPSLVARAVEPAELARAFALGLPDAASALELAVRVAPERAGEALFLLSAHVGEAPAHALEGLVPALRWLAPEAGLGGDAWAWRSWLVARARGAADPSGASGERLELPRAAPDPSGSGPGGLASRTQEEQGR